MPDEADTYVRLRLILYAHAWILILVYSYFLTPLNSLLSLFTHIPNSCHEMRCTYWFVEPSVYRIWAVLV